MPVCPSGVRDRTRQAVRMQTKADSPEEVQQQAWRELREMSEGLADLRTNGKVMRVAPHPVS